MRFVWIGIKIKEIIIINVVYEWGFSNGSIVRDILDDVIDVVGILAVLVVGASAHEVKKTDNWDVEFFFVWVSTVSIWEFAFWDWVVDTWVFSEIVWESTFGSGGTVVFIIQLFAGLFRWFRSIDLSFEGVWEMAAESVFAVPHVVMDAWIKASIDVLLAAVFFAFAFLNRKVLVSAKVLNHFKLTF